MIALIGLFKLSARCNEHSIIPILDSCVFSDITTMTLSIPTFLELVIMTSYRLTPLVIQNQIQQQL